MNSAQRRILILIAISLAVPAFAARNWLVFESTSANGGMCHCDTDAEINGAWLEGEGIVESAGIRFSGYALVSFDLVTGGVVLDYEPVSNAEYAYGSMGANAADVSIALLGVELGDSQAMVYGESYPE